MIRYSKKQIDKLLHQAVFLKCSVLCTKLSEEEISNMNLTKDKHEKSNSDEPPKKKLKLDSIKPSREFFATNTEMVLMKVDSKESDTACQDKFKLVLSKESKSDVLKSSMKPSKEIPKTSTKEVLMKVDSKESDTAGQDKFKLVLSKESKSDVLKSPIKPLKEISATSTEGVSMEVDCTVSTATSSTNSLIGKIWCCDFKSLVEEPKLTPNVKTSLDINPKSPTNYLATRVKLDEIEQVYIKYFRKSIQNTIVTVANIFNMMEITNIHHKAQFNGSMKHSAAEKLKEKSRLQYRYREIKIILEAKLKHYFLKVVSTFEESDFELTFKLFFLSLLTVIKVLDESIFVNGTIGTIFKNLVLILGNNLRNSPFKNPKIDSNLRNIKFHTDCIDLKSIIVNSQVSDPGVTVRLAIFFVTSVNSSKYFQPVIKAMHHVSKTKLGILIDYASYQYSINSMLRDPIQSSPVKIPMKIIPMTANETIQHWVIQKKTGGNVYIPVKNGGYRLLTNGHSVEPSIGANIYKMSSNFFADNIQYQLVMPSNQMSCGVNGNSRIYNKSSPPLINIQCYAKYCDDEATVMCSRCTSVRYCSKNCQQMDWYENHMFSCKK